MRGFIYVLSNPSFSGLLKIGKTSKDPESRIEELSSSTGVPERFELEYFAFVNDMDITESQVHDSLSKERQNKNREFFRTTAREARSTIINCAKNTGGIEFEKKYFSSEDDFWAAHNNLPPNKILAYQKIPKSPPFEGTDSIDPWTTALIPKLYPNRGEYREWRVVEILSQISKDVKKEYFEGPGVQDTDSDKFVLGMIDRWDRTDQIDVFESVSLCETFRPLKIDDKFYSSTEQKILTGLELEKRIASGTTKQMNEKRKRVASRQEQIIVERKKEERAFMVRWFVLFLVVTILWIIYDLLF